MVEQILSGSSSIKVKENALFVLSQSRSARAHEILGNVAKGGSNPDLQMKAIRYLGAMGGRTTPRFSQLYQAEPSVEVKKQILQAMFVGGDADKLVDLAKSEKDPELRKSAIHNLGMMKRSGTSEALTGIYASDASLDVKKAVVNALFIQNNAAALVGLARAEKNPEMKKEIVSRLSVMKSKEATDYMLELLK
jgi:HEAT repeat protein